MNKLHSKNPRLVHEDLAWELVDTVDESKRISGVELNLKAYAAQRQHDGFVVTGSWAGTSKQALDIAYFELLERIALMEVFDGPRDRTLFGRSVHSGLATGSIKRHQLFEVSTEPEKYQFAKSNGLAIGSDFASAAYHALCEKIERHLVLGAWYGGICPKSLTSDLSSELKGLEANFRVEHFEFGSFKLKDGFAPIMATGSFIWPHDRSKPVIYGFAAHEQLEIAKKKSLAEAVQRLCFLDDVEPVSLVPEFSPRPDYHQEYFMHPCRREILEAWLAGAFFEPSLQASISFQGGAQAFDITPSIDYPGRVVRIMIPGTLPLAFGHFQPAEFPNLSPERLLHPIV